MRDTRSLGCRHTQLKARMPRQNLEKTSISDFFDQLSEKKLQFRSFFDELRVGRFIVTGLLVIPTGNRFSSSNILKFKFVTVFDRF
jgi:hypothetical protein